MTFELHSEDISSDEPRCFTLLTHGLLGAGRNLRSLARALVHHRPDRGIVLADLREHGQSMGAPPPHTLAAAAADLCALAGRLAEDGKKIDSLIGHSLGGKAVLLARAQIDVAQTWVLDSSLPTTSPPYAGSETMRVVEMLESMPEVPYPRREDFVKAIEGRGYSRPLALWLATNLENREDRGGYFFGCNMASIRSLIESYFEIDGWSLLNPSEGEEIHVVLGRRSTNHAPGDREKLARIAETRSGVMVHDIDAGHWLHSERKDELAELLAGRLPAP